MQRYQFHVYAQFHPRFRAFAQIKSGFEVGRRGGPRPIDEDRLDWHQGFVDIGIGTAPDRRGVVLRVGRQELNFGSQRLVSVREGPNVRQSFDAVRAGARTTDWRVDAFVSRPATTAAGVFDDRSDRSRAFWGAYAVRAHDRGTVNLDLYYLGLERRPARFDQGAGDERRHTAGTRLWGRRRSVDYNTEAAWQWGTFGHSPIRAWGVASDTGWHVSAPGHPRLGLRADITSGDGDRARPSLGTFNALFPRGDYFSLMAPVGPYNHMALHPQVAFRLPGDWGLSGDWLWFWRARVDDGVYGVPGQLLRSGAGTSQRFVGQSPGIMVWKNVTPHFSVLGLVSWFSASAFIQEGTPARDISFVAANATYRF